MSEIRLVPPPKPSAIARLLSLEAKPLAMIGIALALLSLGLHFKGGQAEAVKAIAQEIAREAMTDGALRIDGSVMQQGQYINVPNDMTVGTGGP